MRELEADEYCSTERHHCSLFTHLILSRLTDERSHWESAERQQGTHMIGDSSLFISYFIFELNKCEYLC